MDFKNTQKNHIAIIHPSGKINLDIKEKETRIDTLKKMGFDVTEIEPLQESFNKITAAPVIERTTLLSYALTMRKFYILFAARGGMGCTELVPFLENILPPIIPDKILVGFSDISFLGVYLALRYPNLKYVHAQNAFSTQLFTGPQIDQDSLFDTLFNKETKYFFSTSLFSVFNKKEDFSIEGVCIPINLSLAESLSSLYYLNLPKKNILFIEECHESLYKIIRKLDSLINSNFIENTVAIVLGSFTDCLDAQKNLLHHSFIVSLFSQKTNLPIFSLPIFGHGEFNFPLVMKSKIKIHIKSSTAQICITNKIEKSPTLSTNFPTTLFSQKSLTSKKSLNIHLTGIGGTGMAQVAGLLKSAGHHMSGSDHVIYPPMDRVIAHLGIKPHLGFSKENILQNNPNAIIVANVISRIGAHCHKNPELEEILARHIPLFSFPSLLRKYFLSESKNMIISGTHGKTTTSSLMTHLLTQLGKNPSFLIGGQPANFKAGFALRSKNLFVLEGDEYDCAFFDKGPKFLHYEPKICLLNNIEFDHADIYPHVESIEEEFLRLARLTKERHGILIVNLNDKRCVRVAQKSKALAIGFCSSKSVKKDLMPFWQLKKYQTFPDGIEVECRQPNGKIFKFKTGIFGEHNALNTLAALAILQANQIIDDSQNEKIHKIPKYNENKTFLKKIKTAMASFRGVKRRFELLQEKNGIAVFDDFAHHPTAISTTLEAFRSYMKSLKKTGRLIVCFDPKNATMRRNILQNQLVKSFFHADLLFLGKVPKDLRISQSETLDGHRVAQACGKNARYFDDNEKLLEILKQEVSCGDTIVFMSSGSFDGIPYRFANDL
jgi:UDP-N-acetylmuramate: L-alanyl-gamma-D-glutamyl-meso-diaminopimelate ligase